MTRTRIGLLASGGGSNLQAILDHLASLGAARHGDVVLVASNRPDAGALARAERAGISRVVLRSPHAPDGAELAGALADHGVQLVALAGYMRLVPPEVTAAFRGRMLNVHPALLPEFGGPGMYGPRVHRAVLEAGAALAAHGVELVALAGYMRLVPPDVTAAFRGRMLNVHPALLPEFGGPGMYGPRVHRAVLHAGASLSGPSVHFVDEVYDHGALIAQWPVPVLSHDDEHSLAARVLRAEHLLYPRVVDAVAAGEVRLGSDGRAVSDRFAEPRLPTMDPDLDDATLAAALDEALARTR